jgi:hypothetical protein
MRIFRNDIIKYDVEGTIFVGIVLEMYPSSGTARISHTTNVKMQKYQHIIDPKTVVAKLIDQNVGGTHV